MKDIIHFEPLTREKYDTYIEVGQKAYNQHYLHLWPNGDTSPYVESSFTKAVLEIEELNNNTLLFLINWNKTAVGILKITLDKALDKYTKDEALYVDKIYIKKEFTRKGVGLKVLQFVSLRATELCKKIVWLDTMQKGPALNFYLNNQFTIYGKTEVPFKGAIESERPMFIMVKKV